MKRMEGHNRTKRKKRVRARSTRSLPPGGKPLCKRKVLSLVRASAEGSDGLGGKGRFSVILEKRRSKRIRKA